MKESHLTTLGHVALKRRSPLHTTTIYAAPSIRAQVYPTRARRVDNLFQGHDIFMPTPPQHRHLAPHAPQMRVVGDAAYL